MNEVPKIGNTTEDLSLLGYRDAFHVPAILARASQVTGYLEKTYSDETDDYSTEDFREHQNYLQISPGDPVRFLENGSVVRSSLANSHGIVDPFASSVSPIWRNGTEHHQVFWIILNPGSVQKLRHNFETPFDFKLTPEQVQAEVSYILREQDLESAAECAGCY